MRRGINHAASASAPPTPICKTALIASSDRVNTEAITPQDRIADNGGGQGAKMQAEHERPRKSDAPPAAIDPALDDPRRAVAAEQKQGRPPAPVRPRGC